MLWAADGDITAVRISNATNGNGWVAEIDIENLSTGGTYAFGMNANNSDPENSKVVFTVTSEGYSTSAVLGTKTRLVYGVPDVNEGAVRKTYPNQTSPDETSAAGVLTIRIALSDFIYADDTATVSIGAGWYTEVGGDGGTTSAATTDLAVTNASTLAYPLPVGRWAWVPYEQVKASSYIIEASIFHRFAENGKPLAAVVFTCTDESAHSVSYTVNEMTRSTRDGASVSGNKVLVYQANVDLTTLTALENVTCNFLAYPWVGDAAAVLDSSTNADPDERLTPFVFFNDKSNLMLGGVAIVDGTNGATWSSGHANVFTTEADAVAAYGTTSNSWKTIADAAQAIRDYNADHSGTGDDNAGGGTILLIAGNYDPSAVVWPTSAAMMDTWLTIKPVSTITDNTSVVFNARAGAQFMKANTKLKYERVTFNTTDTYMAGATAALVAHMWIDGCAYATVGIGPHYGIRHRYMTNSTIAQAVADTSFTYGVALSSWRIMRGNEALHAATSVGKQVHPYCIIGNKGFTPYATCCKTGNTAGLQIYDNGIWAFNSQVGITGATTGGALVFDLATEITYGYAVVQNLIENDTGASGQPNMAIFHDSVTSASNNILIWNNTLPGNRINWGYNDGSGPSATTADTAYLHKNWSAIGNMCHSVNNKDDTFGSPKTISGITDANPGVVTTSTTHGFTNAWKVYIYGITDVDAVYQALNGTSQTVANKAASTFEIADTSAAADNCTSGCGIATMQNPGRTGSWPVGYRVGMYGNVFYQSESSGDWMGEATGMYSTPYEGATLAWFYDTTTRTGDASGTAGNYYINANSTAHNLLPAGKNVLPYDLDGNRRRNEADDAGCYTRGLGKIF
jgi:hypothetical protein